MVKFICKVCSIKIRSHGKHCSHACKAITYKSQFKGKNNPFYGKKHNSKTIKKMSILKKGKPCKFIKTKFSPGDSRLVGSNNHNWRGGIYKHSLGYFVKQVKSHPSSYSGYVLEHRLVVEKAIGRNLKTNEIVHHVNEIKSDNSKNNLMAFSSRSAHIRFHLNPLSVHKKEIIFDGRDA